MGNDEYIRLFLRKHHYDGNITVQSLPGMGWENVMYIICNEKDIPSKKQISIEDIQFDILSDLPEDVFYEWITYCEEHENIEYQKWFTDVFHLYIAKVDNSSSEKLREEIESSIEEAFSIFQNKYIIEDDEFDSDDFEDSDY